MLLRQIITCVYFKSPEHFFFLTFYYLFSFFHIFKRMPLLVKSSIATLEKPLASRLLILV